LIRPPISTAADYNKKENTKNWRPSKGYSYSVYNPTSWLRPRHCDRRFATHDFPNWGKQPTASFQPFSEDLLRTLMMLLLLVPALTMAAGKSVYDFTLNSIDGQATPLSSYKGKVVLVVNVASKCGYTPQYSALESTYEKYKDRGLVIVGVPANNFGSQEPGTNEEIKTFCTRKYNVTFPMMAKVSVKGADQTPLYQFLTDKAANPSIGGEIKWNFTKFLFDREGNAVARFEPEVTPDAPVVTAAIEKALGK
jgi:glutathione peroxidase